MGGQAATALPIRVGSAAAMFALGWARLFVFSLGIAAAYGFWLRMRVLTVLHQVDEALHDLDLLAGLFRLAEQEKFQSPALRDLHTRLTARGKLASALTPPSYSRARVRPLRHCPRSGVTPNAGHVSPSPASNPDGVEA